MSLDAFALPAPDLAKNLLSTVVFHRGTAGMIVETEAYLGGDDLAAHSSHGLTNRTTVIFGPAGRAYIYLIYGIYECLNVVADVEGVPGCVLIRALEPLCGLPLMYQRRRTKGASTNLANGPGKLTQALDITRKQYGHRLDAGQLRIRRWRHRPIFETVATPRIGISQCIDWPLRFVWAGHPCLSRHL
jgi:DNA-3-methyladenine glycosylase